MGKESHKEEIANGERAVAACRLMREVEKLGANVTASASREQMSYTIDALKINVPEAVEMLCDAVLNPRLNGWEVEEQRQRLEQLLKDPGLQASLLTEATVRAAYSGPLGNALIPDAADLQKLTPEVLSEFVAGEGGGCGAVPGLC